VAPSDAAAAPHSTTNEPPHPDPGAHDRTRPAQPMATRAHADLAFLRTFGFRPPTPDEPEIAFEGR
jgi:hypothetical protein